MLQPGVNVIKQAMKLNNHYTDFMPHTYLYQYNVYYVDLDKVESANLVNKESEITEKWLEIKLGKDCANNLIKECVNNNEKVQEIWGLIMESFDKWGLSKVKWENHNI